MLGSVGWKPSRGQEEAIVVDGEQFVAQVVGEEGIADVMRRTELFDVVAKDFACSVGKVGLTNAFSMQSFNYLSDVFPIHIFRISLLTNCFYVVLCSLKVDESVTNAV